MITRETNEELLLMMLFFGFLLFAPSLPTGVASAGFSSPNPGASTLPFNVNVGVLFFPRLIKDTFTPDVGGAGTVARGLGLMIGASDGWGGGVARCKSSLRWYVPIVQRGVSKLILQHFNTWVFVSATHLRRPAEDSLLLDG